MRGGRTRGGKQLVEQQGVGRTRETAGGGYERGAWSETRVTSGKTARGRGMNEGREESSMGWGYECREVGLGERNNWWSSKGVGKQLEWGTRG